ncbi:MAG TPA: DivIVA domain-containing protein [Pseudonocardiaceae bacterium]|jgi:DivIVA domain-containing protein|nr:DivIVA domain-containing protein [Pseudonocardiaceae bacterium]
MPLTPADIRNVAFSKPPIGKRGYSEDEVDAFLDLVGGELTRLLDQIHDLNRQVEQRDRQLRVAAAEPARPLGAARRPPIQQQTPSTHDHDTQAAKVLGMAQQIADRLTGDAKAEANGILTQARSKSEQLLSDARMKADGMVNEARSRAQIMINNAHDKASELERQSQDKATALEHDAARKHAEIIGSISQEKIVLEKKVDELRTFETEYRTRVKTYLESQLRELELRAFGAPTAAAAPRQQEFAAAGFSPPAEAGAHRADPQYGTGVADVARIPAPRNGSFNREPTDEAGVHGMRWEPAV